MVAVLFFTNYLVKKIKGIAITPEKEYSELGEFLKEVEI